MGEPSRDGGGLSPRRAEGKGGSVQLRVLDIRRPSPLAGRKAVGFKGQVDSRGGVAKAVAEPSKLG